jgi:FlaA1/EpsC-like NDP-sugar epimerase
MPSEFRDRASRLPRRTKQALLVGFDTLALFGVLWLSFSLRLGGSFTPSEPHFLLMLLAPVVAIPIFVRMGLYRAVIRYLPEQALFTILKAMALATLGWVFVLFLAEATRLAVFPRTIPLFYFLFGSIVVAGARYLAKALLRDPAERASPAKRVAIYGAGPAGTQLAAALRSDGARSVAAFIDDDPALAGRDMSGIRVHPATRIEELIRTTGISEIILSLPGTDAASRAAIVSRLAALPVRLTILPAIADLASGKYLVSQLREIEIDDLLGRTLVPPDPALLGEILTGRIILVTGAGGSIGSELTRLIARWQPKKLVLFEANEFALYEIERRLRALNGTELVPVLGSVTDAGLVRRTLAAHGVEVIFHAAAHKHVPLLELNPLEAVRNNVVGTRVLAEAARAAGVGRFVLISTDKAVRPSSVMGATKRWAERIVRAAGAAADPERQRFCAVRFGNVLGSNGSVVPLFREQIARGGPVTLTDFRMTRYFMSIHEAAELIVQAGAMSEGGDVFLLEMGEPVRIADLAENMIRLAGLSVRSDANPTGDIALTETGIRPGEKLTEELFYDPARARPTRHPRILQAATVAPPPGLTEALADLEAALLREDEPEVRRLLFAGVAEPR